MSETPIEPAKERPAKAAKPAGEAVARAPKPAKTARRPAESARSERGPARWAGGLVLCLLLLAGGRFAWQYLEPLLLKNKQYLITEDKYSVTPTPSWVPSDVKSEVLRGAGLNQPHSLFDEDLARKVSTAFSLHPWVRQVRVTKHAGGVRVDISYRKPVMVVDVAGRLEPVDIDGVRLPEADVPPSEKNKLPRLAAVSWGPSGPPGTPWGGNEQVASGARVAAALTGCWTELKLAQLEPAPRTYRTPENEPDLFYLYTASRKTRIIWGHAPGASKTEPSGEEKVIRLRAYLAAHGSFDSGDESFDLDLRPADQILKTPRMAKQMDGTRERR